MPCATADLCDEFGAEVRVAEPLLRDWGGVDRFRGPIETLRVFEDNALVRQVLESPGRGRVLVVDGGGSLRSALVGGNLAALALRNGWTGIVVHGCVRDIGELGGRRDRDQGAQRRAPEEREGRGRGAGRSGDLRRRDLHAAAATCTPTATGSWWPTGICSLTVARRRLTRSRKRERPVHDGRAVR